MECRWWVERARGWVGWIHVGVFLGVHYGCDGDAEVGGWAPEVCRVRLWSVVVSNAFVVFAAYTLSQSLAHVRMPRFVLGVKLTGRAEVVGYGISPYPGIESLDCRRHDVALLCRSAVRIKEGSDKCTRE